MTEPKNNFDHLYEMVREASQLDTKGTLVERGLKLCEETGELAAEILKSVGYKYHRDTPEQIRKGILLESVDCMIMVLDILNKAGYAKEEIMEMAVSQLDKWKNQTERK